MSPGDRGQTAALAEEPVSSEPVSGPDSLFIRENTGNFAVPARIHYPMDHKNQRFCGLLWENSLLGGTGNFSCLTGTQIRPTAKFGRRIREEHGPLRRR